MQIFICAAGIGSRLSDFTEGKPKSLMNVHNCSIMEYLLKILTHNKRVTEINIIVGYKCYDIISFFGGSYNGVTIKYHVNPDFESTGNLYSLFCAKESMCDDIVFMTADLIISPKLIHNFLSEQPGNKVLTDADRLAISREDVVRIVDCQSVILDISKVIKSKKATGAAVGLYRLNKMGKNAFFEISENLFKQRNGHESSFMRPIPYMPENCVFKTSVHKNFSWFDVDTNDDLKKARMLSPEIYCDL